MSLASENAARHPDDDRFPPPNVCVQGFCLEVRGMACTDPTHRLAHRTV